jgi:3-oxoadipate enol-lactonase
MPIVRVENEGPIEIHYEEVGSGDPLVLVGGLTSSWEVWGLMTPELEKHLRVITADNRGTGETHLSEDDEVRTPRRFAGDVVALLDALEIERAHILGASMGGMIVQELALDFPSRVATLSILCSNMGGSQSVQPEPEVTMKLISQPSDGAPESLDILVHPDSLAKRASECDFYLETKRRAPHSREELIRRAKGVATFRTGDRLADLDVPTLVMTGSHDRLVPKEKSQRISLRISAAEYVEIADAGHIFFVEQARAVNEALLDFLERHPI